MAGATYFESEKWEAAMQACLFHLNDKSRTAQEAAAEGLAVEVQRLSALLSPDSFGNLIHDLNRRLFELVSSPDIYDRLGAVIAISKLAEQSRDEITSSLSRYANYLRTLLPTKDPMLMVAAAAALAKLVSATHASPHMHASDLIDFDMERSFAWIQEGDLLGTYAALFTFKEVLQEVPHLALIYAKALIQLTWTALALPRTFSDSPAALAVLGNGHKFPPLRQAARETLREVLLSIKGSSLPKADVVENIRFLIKVSIEQIDMAPASTLSSPARLDAEAKGGGAAASAARDVHGSLIALHLLVQIFPGTIMERPFADVSRSALHAAKRRDQPSAVHQEAILLITSLAGLDPDAFARDYLIEWTALLTNGAYYAINRADAAGSFQSDAERSHRISSTLLAIRNTAEALGTRISPMAPSLTKVLSAIMATLKEGKSASSPEEAAEAAEEAAAIQSLPLGSVDGSLMECIAALARALKESFAGALQGLLPALLADRPFSQSLRSALYSIVDNVPSATALIQDHMLESAEQVLSQSDEEIDENDAIVTAALETISRFTFCEPILGGPVGRDILRLLGHPKVCVRRGAALASVHLIRPDAGGYCHEPFHICLALVTTLMTIVTSDSDTQMQCVVIEALNDGSFDFYLSAPEPFALLLMVLNASQYLPCRLAAIAILERISRKTTGLIFPHFRGILLGLLADLTCTHPKTVAEDAAIILSEVTKMDASLVRPTVEPLLRALSPRLLDPNPNTATAILVTLGRLVQVDPLAFNMHASTLVESIAKVLSDQSSSKRRMAALGFLCTLLRNVDRHLLSTECFAGLLLRTADLLRIELVRPVRNEAIKLVGVIGALDPYKMRTIEMERQFSSTTFSATASVSTASQQIIDFNDELPQSHESSGAISTLSEEYYPNVAIRALLKLLKDTSLLNLHANTIQSLLVVFQSLNVKSSVYLSEVMPELLFILREGDPTLHLYILEALSSIVSIVGLHIRPFVADLLAVVNGMWKYPMVSQALATAGPNSGGIVGSGIGGASTKGHQPAHAVPSGSTNTSGGRVGPSTISVVSGGIGNATADAISMALLTLVGRISEALSGETHVNLPPIVPLVLSMLSSKYTPSDREDLILAILSSLQSLSPYARDHSHAILAAMIDLVREIGPSPQSCIAICTQCLSLVYAMIDQIDVRHELSLIVSLLEETRRVHERLFSSSTTTSSSLERNQANPPPLVRDGKGGGRAGSSQLGPLHQSQHRILDLIDNLCCYLAINCSEEFAFFQNRFVSSHTAATTVDEKFPQLHSLLLRTSTWTQGREFPFDAADNLFNSQFSNALSITAESRTALLELTPIRRTRHSDNYLFPSSSHANRSVMSKSPILASVAAQKLAMNEANLRKSWDPTGCTSRDNWFHWMRCLESKLLEESPSPALRACAPLASSHYPLARNLFNAAFVACWSELSDPMQDDLIGSIERALASETIPPELMQAILNLAEFMQRDDRPLPMNFTALGSYAMKCHAYAKALYYQEAEFESSPSAASVEALISINSQTQQPDSAVGILVYAQKHHGIVLEESWFEKLHRWDEALSAYQRRWEQDSERYDALLGIFRCWHALGDWDSLNALAKQVWPDVPDSVRSALAPLASASAWSSENWKDMAEYVSQMSNATTSSATSSTAPLSTHGTGHAKTVSLSSSMPAVGSERMSSLASYGNIQSGIGTDGGTGLETPIFKCVLAIHKRSYTEAERHVTFTRELLDMELTAMIGESYGRAYNTIVRAQALSELEEVVKYCQTRDAAVVTMSDGANGPPGTYPANSVEEASNSCMARIRDCWAKRLDDCQMSVNVWQKILKIRSLVLPPECSLERWIKFASLCRRNDRPIMSRKILLTLLHADERNINALDLTKASPLVVYGFLKHNWEIGEHGIAVRYMRQYARFLAQQLDRSLAQMQQSLLLPLSSAPPGGGDLVTPPTQTHLSGAISSGFAVGGELTRSLEERSRLLARCYYKLGDWQKTMASVAGEEYNGGIVENFLAATSYDKNWSKAWHGWALINFEMAMSHEHRYLVAAVASKTGPNPSGSLGQTTHGSSSGGNQYLVPAIQGFFRAISLSNGENSLQDSLRLLTLWFKYGTQPDVNAAVGDGFLAVPVDNWLQVIPQLIARIHVPSQQVRRRIHHLLTEIGKHHPQALIYPLTVASKSQSVARRTSALAILDKMRSHSARLVEQANMISQELIRLAILWEELWYEGLEEASKVYFGENNIGAMLAILEPLHQMIEGGGETARERAFLDAYGGDLKDAREQCKRYKRSSSTNDISIAWDIYYQVFRRLSKTLPQLSSIDLSSTSPKLLAAADLDIAIPGTYRAASLQGGSIVRISSFSPTVGVIGSKQRPRKMVIVGDDGERYKFLLKGHEDLRQDERVMQLFGLVNMLLADDGATRKRHLQIERFSVIPLSQNTGLIGWVSHCDTLHSLVRDYRETHGVLLSIEHRLMLQFAPDYDRLPLVNKVEVFSHAMDNTDGRDLGRIMWQRSLTSEMWLERRLTYTRSLAVMSMVGYILGLGDRHPSNLMVDQVSGRVVHIDFGDCFEVAMHRDKFPERVPFRLSRMLSKAMEVSGIEGTFRITCENTMRVLRTNKDSLMAVLEAFVYDPLINWRLIVKGGGDPVDQTSSPPFAATITGGGAAAARSNRRPSTALLSGGNFSAVDGSSRHFPENFSSSRRFRRDEEISRLEDESINRPESINSGALNVINRVSNKLTGRDFKNKAPLDVPRQVDRLIIEAVAVENLCQAYVGWCAFW